MTVEKTLRELKHDILRTDTASQFTLVKLVCNVSRRLALQEDALYNLRKITRDGSAYAAMIRAGVDKKTMADMVNARALLARIVSPALMGVAERRVAHLCKLTFGIQLPRSLVMKAKIHHNISRGKLRHIAKHIVDESDAPQAVKAMIIVATPAHRGDETTLTHGYTNRPQALRQQNGGGTTTGMKMTQPPTHLRENRQARTRPRKRPSEIGGGAEPRLDTACLQTAAKEILWPAGDEGHTL